MKTYWSERARRITPYTAGEQPRDADMIKLNTNENPYPPSPLAIAAIEDFHMDKLRLYPNASSEVLRRAAAYVHGLSPEQVFCGNGSDEVLAIAFQAFFDDALSFCDISYSFYPVWAEMYGISYETVPLREDFTVPAEAFYGKKNIVLANPNAPTSLAQSRDEIEEIVRRASGVVIVDEAYVAFGAQTALPLIKKYDNLLVVRTFSKSHGLAGLRVGYAMGHPDLIAAMNCIKDSFNSYPVDALAQRAAAAALMDTSYAENIAKLIIHAREYTEGALKALGFQVLPAMANFVFAKPPAGISAQEMMQKLKERHIYVRWFSGARIREYLRISIGTMRQMEQMAAVVREILETV